MAMSTELFMDLAERAASYPDDLKALQAEAWRISNEHQFHDPSVHVGEQYYRGSSPLERMALAASEIAEAVEFARDAKTLGADEGGLMRVFYHDNGKPDGFLIELADCVIRIMDTVEDYGGDLLAAIKIKMAYNESREPMHGRGI
jgi:hypothetical protein